MSAELIIYAVVAAGLVVWLRNILGTRQDGDAERPNPYLRTPEQTAAQQSAHDVGPMSPLTDGAETGDITAGLDRTMSIENDIAQAGLMEIARADKFFKLPTFLTGAQDAFVMIVEGFADGDRELLSELLSPAVYKAFEGVINQRADEGDKASVEIHAIRKSEVMSAEVKGKMAFITVRFTADETSIVRDKDGVVTFGDPDRVTETIDIWTFGREIKSKNPAWLVYETREAEGDELSGSTVPETDKDAKPKKAAAKKTTAKKAADKKTTKKTTTKKSDK